MTPSTPNLTRAAPCFVVPDVVKAAEYYRDRLGFHYDRLWGDPPDFVMVYRDGVTVMLAQVSETSAIRPNTTIVADSHSDAPGEPAHDHYAPWDAYIWCADAEALHADFVKRGASIVNPPVKTGYGNLELMAKDLDGYVIAFGQPLEG